MNSRIASLGSGCWRFRIGISLPWLTRASLAVLVMLLAATTASNVGAESSARRVSKVTVSELEGGGAEVIVRTDHEPDYIARLAQGGKRLIIDLRGAKVDGAAPALTGSKGVLGGVLVQPFVQKGVWTTRLLIQLLAHATYRVMSSSNGLRVVFQKASQTGPAPRAPMPTGTKTARYDLGGLLDVRYEHGRISDRVVVQLRGMPRYSDAKRSSTRSVLTFEKASLPQALERKLDVAAYGGLVRAISMYRRGQKVFVDVDHQAGASGTVVRYGSAVHYVFGLGRAPSMLTGVAADGQVARKTKSLTSEPVVLSTVEQGLQDAAREWTSEPDRAGAFLSTAVPMQQRRYAGRRIDLDLKDADIDNVLRILADVGKVNLVTADNVTGTVTIRMKNVPWDQALDTVLQAKKLGMVRQGNIIRVALAADLNKERELAVERRKSELLLASLETRLIPVSYAQAVDMQSRAQSLLSPRGTLAVDGRTNVLIARDVPGNLNQIEELIRALDTQTPQVLIEARIVEATSRFTRDIGVQWGGDLAFGPATGNPTGLGFPSSINLAGGGADAEAPTSGLSATGQPVANPNFVINLPAAVGTGSGGAIGLTLGSLDNTINVNVRLSAAEATGMLRIVSSPRILTLDNNEAKISQGTLIPFAQVSAQGVQTVFQEAKLQLMVRPHVTADGSVSLHVKINRDEPDFNQTGPRGDPTILKREAETELLVRDGHTAVIGGIYSRNTGRNLDQVPLLGDIPVLGVLFQRRRSSDQRSELVIFITPRIVNRAEALGR